MKKIKLLALFAFLFVLLPHSAKAQVPSFDCSKSIQIYTDVTTGNLYACKITAGVGTWTLAGGGTPNPAGTTVSGSDITFPGAVNTSKIDNIVYVDGTTYPRTAAGINAAIVAAGVSGKVVVTPGAYTLTAQIILNNSGVEVTGYGAVLTCNIAASCIKINSIGDVQTNHQGISFNGFWIKPGTGSGGTGVGNGFSGIQDNGEHTTLQDIGFCGNGASAFDHAMEFDNDQSVNIIRPSANVCNTTFLTNTATFVGSFFWAPGPFPTNAAVGRVSGGDISLNCVGNGVDWESVNTLRISDTVIQGYSQYAIKNFGGFVALDNVYREAGTCTNPIGNVGQTDVLMEGGQLIDEGGENIPGAIFPNFTTNGTPGSTLYHYWIVATESGGNVSTTMAAGMTTTGNATVSGTNSINVVWNKIGTATLYDVLRKVGTLGADSSAPVPGVAANTAVTTSYTQATCGANVCTFIDTVPTGSLSAYTPAINPFYMPVLKGWPGGRVLTVDATGNEIDAPNAAAALITSQPGSDVDLNVLTPNITYQSGTKTFPSNNFPYSPVIDYSPGLRLTGAAYFPALLLPSLDYFGTVTNLKGRLNFGSWRLQATNTDIVTFLDSNFPATLATMSHRPTAAAGDSAICMDAANALCIRSQISISNYINSLPDGSSFLERLTSSLKTFTVPISGIGLLCTQHAALGHATANTITDECPAAVTAYENVRPGTAASGILLNSNAANVETQSFSGDSNHSVHVTAQTATKTIYTLCPATAGGCNVAGQYRVTWYFNQGGTACGTPTPGQVTFALSWTDNAGAHSAIALPMNDNSSIAVFTSAFKFAASNTTGFASGEFNLWSTGAQPIQVTNTYTACGVGTGTWELTAAVEQIQ